MRHFIKPTVKLGIMGGAIYAAVHFGGQLIGEDTSAQAVIASLPSDTVVQTIETPVVAAVETVAVPVTVAEVVTEEVIEVAPVLPEVIEVAEVVEEKAAVVAVVAPASEPTFVKVKKEAVAKAPVKKQRMVYYYMPPYHPGMLPPPPPPMPFF